MITFNNDEMPIGFMMEMATNPAAMNHFSNMTKDQQSSCVEGARNISSKAQMRNYVSTMMNTGGSDNETAKFF